MVVVLVSGLPGAFYSICWFLSYIILEFKGQQLNSPGALSLISAFVICLLERSISKLATSEM